MSDSAFTAPGVPGIGAISLESIQRLLTVIRSAGLEAAVSHAAELAAVGTAPQLHADLLASAGRFEEAYHSASQSPGPAPGLAPKAGSGPVQSNGARHARLALFADSLGNHEAARRYSEITVTAQPSGATLDWIVWLINVCGAHSAAAHMLRAYQSIAPDDARAPWWLAIALDSLHGPGPRAERRAALVRAYSLDPGVDPALPLQVALALRAVCDWPSVERVCREALARDPADLEMAWQLSHAQWQCNNAAAAEATMRAANAAAPGNADVLAAIGLYLCEQARYEERSHAA